MVKAVCATKLPTLTFEDNGRCARVLEPRNLQHILALLSPYRFPLHPPLPLTDIITPTLT